MSDVKEKIEQLKKFDQAYFSGTPIISDAQYDLLKQQVYQELPEHEYFKRVGSEVRGEKVKLPYPMGSLNQIYENDCEKWVKNYNLFDKRIIVTDKLDGVSCLLVYNYGKLSIAYSRGDGYFGHDITRHIRKLNIPTEIDNGEETFAIRAEVIMKNNTFKVNHSKNFKNPRNMVAGCLNRKETEKSILKDIDLICYEIVDSSTKYSTKLESLSYLKALGFTIVPNFVMFGKELNDNALSKILKKVKEESEYELDGIVLTADHYKDVEKISKADTLNPEHSVKYKVLDEDSIREVKVKKVHWKVSKNGYYKPRIEITPVELFGTTVTFSTGFNGKFIYENGIGAGAIIKITKSGSVIPYVVSIVKKAAPDLPESWEWDENKVEFIVKDAGSNKDVIFMQVLSFFKTLEIDQLQEANLKKMFEYYDFYENDFTSIVKELFGFLEPQWKKVLGVNGSKIYTSLHKTLNTLKEEKLLGAIPFFGRGFGVRKARKLLSGIDFNDLENVTLDEIVELEGFDVKTASQIKDNISQFMDFYNTIEEFISFEETDDNNDINILDGHKIVFTGFRDKELQHLIEQYGGQVTSAVSGKTTEVLAFDKKSNSGKVKKANELGINIYTPDEFKLQFLP